MDTLPAFVSHTVFSTSGSPCTTAADSAYNILCVGVL